jgi:hypothetical protein
VRPPVYHGRSNFGQPEYVAGNRRADCILHILNAQTGFRGTSVSQILHVQDAAMPKASKVPKVTLGFFSEGMSRVLTKRYCVQQGQKLYRDRFGESEQRIYHPQRRRSAGAQPKHRLGEVSGDELDVARVNWGEQSVKVQGDTASPMNARAGRSEIIAHAANRVANGLSRFNLQCHSNVAELQIKVNDANRFVTVSTESFSNVGCDRSTPPPPLAEGTDTRFAPFS